MANQRYLVTGRVFGKNGELLQGQEVSKEKGLENPNFTPVAAKPKAKPKTLEVATPKE